jgi:hypothetical protein
LRQEKEAHIMPDSGIDAFYEGKNLITLNKSTRSGGWFIDEVFTVANLPNWITNYELFLPFEIRYPQLREKRPMRCFGEETREKGKISSKRFSFPLLR